MWVPQAENVWFRPLCLNARPGYWMNLLRVRKSGVLSPPSPSAGGARLRAQGPLALSGARLGGDRRQLRLRAAGRNPHARRARRRRGNDHLLPGQRRHVLRRPLRRAARATRTSSPRSTCAASTIERSAWARTTSTSSSADAALAALRPDLFAGRQVLVTGGTSGIGAAIAVPSRRSAPAVTRHRRHRRRGRGRPCRLPRRRLRGPRRPRRRGGRRAGRRPCRGSTSSSTAPASSAAAPSTIPRSSPTSSTSTSPASMRVCRRRAAAAQGERRQHRQHRLDAELLRRRPRARLRGLARAASRS